MAIGRTSSAPNWPRNPRGWEGRKGGSAPYTFRVRSLDAAFIERRWRCAHIPIAAVSAIVATGFSLASSPRRKRSSNRTRERSELTGRRHKSSSDGRPGVGNDATGGTRREEWAARILYVFFVHREQRCRVLQFRTWSRMGCWLSEQRGRIINYSLLAALDLSAVAFAFALALPFSLRKHTARVHA